MIFNFMKFKVTHKGKKIISLFFLLFCCCWIRNLSGMGKKIRIRDKDPGSATLLAMLEIKKINRGWGDGGRGD
jgi:hypothetical protein